MNEQETSFDARLHRAKLDAMKELAYGASHEINNPLANISARAQTLLRDELNPDRRRALEAINQQALRAHEMISDLMLFARPPKLSLAATALPQLIEPIITELKPECNRCNIELVATVSDATPPIMGDPVQLAVAVKAVITNAVEAIGEHGKIEIILEPMEQLSVGPAPAAPAVRICIRDTGPGISEKAVPHIFDPFFSGREAGRGLGFGLSKAWRVATEHGGDLRLTSNGPSGAAFAFELPADATPR
jgi:signal transduction histidine kinase